MNQMVTAPIISIPSRWSQNQATTNPNPLVVVIVLHPQHLFLRVGTPTQEMQKRAARDM